MTTEQAHQRLGTAEGVTHELQEQLQRRRTSSSPRGTSIDPSRNEYSPQSDWYEVARPIGGTKEFDARSGREEERPKLENLVVLGKRLRRRSTHRAETGDDGCRKQETADRLDKSPT